jgi:hypothetical protein
VSGERQLQILVLATLLGIISIAWRYRNDPRARTVQFILFGLLVGMTAAALVLHR